MDDRDGRKEALRNNVTVLTTLNILALGAQKNLLNLPTELDRLTHQTNFRMPPAEVVKEMLSRDAERKEREQTIPELTQEAAQEKEQERRDRDIER
jgi:hypothetical protein